MRGSAKRPAMSQTPSSTDLAVFETLVRALIDAAPQEAVTPEQQELCDRVLAGLNRRPALSEADVAFLRSWLRAGDLLLAGLQVLEMADEGSASAIRHERECTETALGLLPTLLDEARCHETVPFNAARPRREL